MQTTWSMTQLQISKQNAKRISMKTGVILLAIVILHATNCQLLGDNVKDRERALFTRYVTLMNYCLSEKNAPTSEKLRREIVVMALINYYYYKDTDKDFSKIFIKATVALSRRIVGFSFTEEFKAYLTELERLDANEVQSVLEFVGFDNNLAVQLSKKTKVEQYSDFVDWVENAAKEKDRRTPKGK